MDEKMVSGNRIKNDTGLVYNNVHCFKIRVLNIGSIQAIYYDLCAL